MVNFGKKISATVLILLTFILITPQGYASPMALPSFANLAEAMQPAVVNISTTQAIPESPQQAMPQVPNMPGMPFPPGSPFEDMFREFFMMPPGMQMNPQRRGIPDSDGYESYGAPRPQSLGSGFIIDKAAGFIVTNNHVIEDAAEIRVTLNNDTVLDATLVGRDPKTDIAVLKVTPDTLTTQITWGDSAQLRVGDWVMAVGNPFGLGGTVTAGIVSARQRNINSGPYDDFIQTDAAINRGNSGGPMFDTAGRVVGINTAIFSPTGGSVGIGFAVPVNLAKPVVDQLIAHGETRRGWLGVRIQEMTPEIASSLGLKDDNGALVASVTPDGPSDTAGVKAGDVILKFNGKAITAQRKLPRLVAESPIGKPSTVTLWRKGKQLEKTVTLGRLEDAEETASSAAPSRSPKVIESEAVKVDALGLEVVAVSAVTRSRYGLSKDAAGVVITKVKTDSFAAREGLRSGLLIVGANQEDVKTPEDLQAVVEAAEVAGKDAVLLELRLGEDEPRFVGIPLE